MTLLPQMVSSRDRSRGEMEDDIYETQHYPTHSRATSRNYTDRLYELCSYARFLMGQSALLLSTESLLSASSRWDAAQDFGV